jgi:hypothetical protein
LYGAMVEGSSHHWPTLWHDESCRLRQTLKTITNQPQDYFQNRGRVSLDWFPNYPFEGCFVLWCGECVFQGSDFWWEYEVNDHVFMYDELHVLLFTEKKCELKLEPLRACPSI